jgi:hypothetical protein
MPTRFRQPPLPPGLRTCRRRVRERFRVNGLASRSSECPESLAHYCIPATGALPDEEFRIGS